MDVQYWQDIYVTFKIFKFDLSKIEYDYILIWFDFLENQCYILDFILPKITIFWKWVAIEMYIKYTNVKYVLIQLNLFILHERTRGPNYCQINDEKYYILYDLIVWFAKFVFLHPLKYLSFNLADLYAFFFFDIYVNNKCFNIISKKLWLKSKPSQ